MSIYQYLQPQTLTKLPKVKKGDILVAKPFVPDLYFNKTVIIVVDCTSDVYVGLILNRKLKGNIEIRVNGNECLLPPPLFEGGPLSDNMFYVLYQNSSDIGYSKLVQNNIYLSDSDNELLFKQICNQTLNSKYVHLYKGLCFWTPELLQNELKQGCWSVVQNNADIIFKVAAEQLWEEMAAKVSLSDDCRWLLPVNPQDN